MEHEFGDKVKFTAVDCSTNKRVAMGFRVMGLPTFLFWKNGVEVKRLSKESAPKSPSARPSKSSRRKRKLL